MGKTIRSLTRRDFLQRTGLTIGVGLGSGMLGCRSEPLAPNEPEAASPDPAIPYAPFQMGFQSYSLRHFQDLASFVEQAGRLGLKHVELYRGHLSTDSTPEQVEQARQSLTAAGLQVNAFGVEAFTADHEANRRLFEFGRALGVRNLSADPSRDAFDSLEKLVQEFDIRIAIHNHGPEDERWRRPEWILDAVKDRDPRIGACADLGHFIRADVDPAQAVAMLGSRVLGVHLKDFDSEGRDVVLGDGRLDLSEALSALKTIDFNGPLSLEYEGDAENPIPAMLECLKRVRGVLSPA